MDATRDDLQRWVDAGLIGPTTASRILSFEAARDGVVGQQEGALWRPNLPELLIYLAAAIIAAGISVLVATNWDQLTSAARIAIPAAASAATFIAGYWLKRRGEDAALRAASLLWLLAGALSVGAVAILATELDVSENLTALIAGLAAIILSISLWSPMRMHPQIVGIGAAGFLLSTAISSFFAEDWIAGALAASLATMGAVALVSVEAEVLVPQSSARLLAAAGLAFGGFFAGMPPSPLIMTLVTAFAVALLLAAGIRYGTLVYVAGGVLTTFAGMLTLILRYVDNPTIAGLSLVAVGLLLMFAIAALATRQPWTRSLRLDHPRRDPV